MKTLAVVGSREFPDEAMVRGWMKQHCHMYGKFVSGGAAGPDSWGLEEWREVHGKAKETERIFKPEWNRYGNYAGMLRNVRIIGEADFVVVFWTAQSAGTLDDLGLLLACGKPYNLYVR